MTVVRSQAEFARMADTPFRGQPIYGTSGADDITRPRPLLRRARNGRKLSVLEIECGITDDEYEEFHRRQREQVRARWGLS